MKGLLRYGGIILVLIGVAVLAVPQFMHTMTNTLLATGLAIIVLGVISTIFLNKLER